MALGTAITGNGTYGFGQTPTDVNPGQSLPNVPNGLPLQPPQPGVSNAERQSFLSPNLMAPYYNAAGVAGNLGTAAGSVVPQATNFMNQMLSPNLNQFEETFLGASLGNALQGMNQGFQRQESQFEETPFHSGLPRAQGDVMEQMFRDMFQTGSQMGLQREQIGAQMSQFPFEFTQQAAQVPVQMQQQAYQQANDAFMQPYKLPMQVWSGIPVSAPTYLANQGGGGKSV